MSEMPVLTLPPKPSFMCVDGKTFLVEQVTQAPEDMMKSIEEYYKDNLDVLREKVGRHLSDESQRDLDAQVLRIERHLTAGVVALPEDLRANGTLLYLQTNKVYATRLILFKPSRISCTMQHCMEIVMWINQLPKRDQERFTKFVEWATPMAAHFNGLNVGMSSIKIDIKIEQDLCIEPMIASLIGLEHAIKCIPDTVHPHVHGGGLLCTGRSTAENFWDDGAFVQNFNSINPHSPANSGVPCFRNYKNMVKNQYFIEARVRAEEASSWRV